ncbi:MAG: AraC family transcriptional regulator [Oceanospirillaceae bacterium]
MDKFKAITNSFSIDTEVIFSGSFCGDKALGGKTEGDCGHLHFLKSGKLTILSDTGNKWMFDKPTVIVLPKSTEHQIISSETQDAEVLCATIKFNALEQQQLIANLPKLISIGLDQGPMQDTINWMFDAINDTGLGHKSIVDKLCDILLIQMFRQLAEQGTILQGMLAGLSHPALAKTIVSLQESPAQGWTLDSMASHAAMSRSKFSELFRETVGQTPNDFLTDLRVSIAQQLLKQDKSVAIVANSVGYEHGSALARVFRKKTGLSPKEWLQKLHAS